MWANEQVQSWRGSRASITFDCDEVRRNAIINQFDRDNIRDEPLKVRERRSLQRTLEHMIARANGRNDRKRGNLLDRINRSMTSIAMMFARANNQGNQRWWGSPERTKKKQQSTSLWLLSYCFLWTSCKNVCTCNPQQCLSSLDGLNIPLFGLTIKTTHRMAMMSHPKKTKDYVPWWLMNTQHQNKRIKHSSCWWFWLCLFSAMMIRLMRVQRSRTLNNKPDCFVCLF